MWNIIAWALFGLVAGIIAKLLMPGRDPGGCIITSLLGIAGAMLGGFIGRALGLADADSFDFGSLILAVVGALLILWLYRKFVTRT